VTIANAQNLLSVRKDEALICLGDLMDCVEYWNALLHDIENSSLVDYHRVARLTNSAVQAIYLLEGHAGQYRKLATSGEIPALRSSKRVISLV
jgi:hypothetical protein